MRNTRTKTLVECALMVALSAILQVIPFIQMPQGGSVTLASMAPLVFIALRHGPKWGLLTAFVGSLVQILLGGLYPPPTPTFFWFLLVVLLDYVVAYTVLGLAPLFAGFVKNPVAGAGVATVCVTLLRFVCHFLSGVLIWAPAGESAVLFSLGYNGSYMVPEIILTTAVVVLVEAVFEKTAGKKAVRA